MDVGAREEAAMNVDEGTRADVESKVRVSTAAELTRCEEGRMGRWVVAVVVDIDGRHARPTKLVSDQRTMGAYQLYPFRQLALFVNYYS